MKGHTNNQKHIKLCKSVQIIAGCHENVYTVTHNRNGMDIKRNGIDGNGTDILCFSCKYM